MEEVRPLLRHHPPCQAAQVLHRPHHHRLIMEDPHHPHRHQLDQVWAVHHLHHRLLVATLLIGAGDRHPHRPLLVENCLTHRELPHLRLCALGDHLHLL